MKKSSGTTMPTKSRTSLRAFVVLSLAISLSTLGFVAPSQATSASPELIDSLIVKYEPGVAVIDSSGDPAGTDSISASVDFNVGDDLGDGYRTIQFTKAIPVEQAQLIASELAGTSEVVTAEPNNEVKLFDTVTQNTSAALWNLDRIDQNSLTSGLDGFYKYPSAGAGVDVYIVDSGIEVSHSEFKNADGTSRVRDGFTASGLDTYGPSCSDHGTHVAGIVGSNTYGVAKHANLISVRVFPCTGSTTDVRVLEGLSFVETDHVTGKPAVVNLSLGSDISDGAGETAVETKIKALIAEGVVVVVSSGNSNKSSCLVSPARLAEAITVNASTLNPPKTADVSADYSNWGACSDIYAPGSSILSTSTSGGTATKSGTSMAAPMVVGVAANMLSEDDTLTPALVWSAISSAATNSISSGHSGDPTKLLYQPLNGWNTFRTTSTTASISPATQSISATANSAISNSSAFSIKNFGFLPTYSISPALPSGLSLNTSTGVISGTPTAEMPSANYTITGTVGLTNIKSATSVVSIAIAAAPAPQSGGGGSGGGGGGAAPAAAPAAASGSAGISTSVGNKKAVTINVSAPAGSRTLLQIYTNGRAKVAYQKAGKTRYKYVTTKIWKTVYSAPSVPVATVRVKSAGTYRVYVNTPSGPVEGAAFSVR